MLSRDINMRVKCDALGLVTEDYQINQVVKEALKINKPVVIDVDVDPKALYSFRRDSFKHRVK